MKMLSIEQELKSNSYPGRGSRDVIENGNLVFSVEEVKDNRISKVRLRILPVQETEEENKGK